MGLLAINLDVSACWACFLISLFFCPLFLSHLLYYWVSFAVGIFVKKWASTGRRLHCCGLVFGEKICGFWEDKMVVALAGVYVFVDFFFLYLVVLCLLS